MLNACEQIKLQTSYDAPQVVIAADIEGGPPVEYPNKITEFNTQDISAPPHAIEQKFCIVVILKKRING
ncbi:hypothetical protein PGB90_007266 [Kerria lacca]